MKFHSCKLVICGNLCFSVLSEMHFKIIISLSSGWMWDQSGWISVTSFASHLLLAWFGSVMTYLTLWRHTCILKLPGSSMTTWNIDGSMFVTVNEWLLLPQIHCCKAPEPMYSERKKFTPQSGHWRIKHGHWGIKHTASQRHIWAEAISFWYLWNEFDTECIRYLYFYAIHDCISTQYNIIKYLYFHTIH